MSNKLHAFDFLEAATELPAHGVVVCFGDEPFLKRLALQRIVQQTLGEQDVPFGRFDGATAEWRDVHDELSTVSLFGGGGTRLAVVDDADKFVTRYRGQLEDFVAKPLRNALLVLDVSKWPGNTRLYKVVAKDGLAVECGCPMSKRGRTESVDEKTLQQWLITRSLEAHDAKLDVGAASLLIELVGPELGMLDQDLAKLALYVGPGGKVNRKLVEDAVGGWRTKTIWELLDATLDGDAAEALLQLDHLLSADEHPVALFGPISWSLRQFAIATRSYERAKRMGRRPTIQDALSEAGIRGSLGKAERHLKQVGSRRASKLFRWLLEADLALKGSHSNKERARFVLEELIVKLSSAMAQKPKRTAATT